MNVRLLTSLVAAGAFACGGHSHDTGEGDLLQTHDAGSTADAGTTDAGVSTLSLTAAFETSPLQRTGNRLHAQLSRAGQPVTGATVTVALWMPAHGHGAPAPSVVEHGGGEYDAHAVTFTMPGTWDVTVTATKDGATATTTLRVMAP